MKKIGLFSFAIAVLLASCGETIDIDKYTISGKLPNADNDGRVVYLQEVGDTWKERVNLDTAIIANGVFGFDGFIENGKALRFVTIADPVTKIQQTTLVILEPGKIELVIDSVSTVNGTELNSKVISEFQQLMDKGENLPDSEVKPLMYNFVKANIDNPVGEYTFASKSYYFDGKQLTELLNLAKPEFKSSKMGERLVKRNEKLEATAIDKQFTDLKGKTPEGKEIALSDYAGKGKYVLVDFWASWCPPCRKDMPYLVEAYAKYKNKGFEIVGVSLDENVADWQNMIKKLKVTWPQMSDLKGWNSELSGAYGVASIPHTVLIDKEGKIIAKYIKGEELIPTLQELIK